MSTLERTIRDAIVKALRERGAWVLVTTGVSRVGVPDLLVCYRGRFIALEVKQEGRYPAPLQYHELDAINAAGGQATYVRSVSEALRVLEAD